MYLSFTWEGIDKIGEVSGSGCLQRSSIDNEVQSLIKIDSRDQSNFKAKRQVNFAIFTDAIVNPILANDKQ